MDNLFGDIERQAIERIQEFSTSRPDFPEGYYLAFSGGKDSCVLKHLAGRSGVKFTSNFACSGIEPHELYGFIREHHRDVIWHKPEIPYLKELERRGLPNPRGAWCCDYIKENLGEGRVLLGIRWAEGSGRSKRQSVTLYKGKLIVSPIIDWTTKEVWEYIHKYNLPYCELYDMGWKRIGCVMCPKATIGNRLKEMKQYPKLARGIKKAAKKSLQYKKEKGLQLIGNGTFREYWHWWFFGSKQELPCDLFN